MSTYIEQADYLPFITDKRLTQVIQDTPALLDDAELTAITVVKDALHANYDIDDIFSKTGPDRHKQVVRWCITLVLYYLFERVPEAVTPQRILNNYEATLETLSNVEGGKISVDLPRVVVDDVKKTNFRWGSQPPRGHNI